MPSVNVPDGDTPTEYQAWNNREADEVKVYDAHGLLLGAPTQVSFRL